MTIPECVFLGSGSPYDCFGCLSCFLVTLHLGGGRFSQLSLTLGFPMHMPRFPLLSFFPPPPGHAPRFQPSYGSILAGSRSGGALARQRLSSSMHSGTYSWGPRVRYSWDAKENYSSRRAIRVRLAAEVARVSVQHHVSFAVLLRSEFQKVQGR